MSVCCSINDSLGAAIDSVLALEPRPDQILIEASGVADPAKVATYGQGWPGCQLDAVVVLADVETIRERSADPFVGELVTRQLSAGDLVLLTKTDLVDADAARTTLRWVAHRAGNSVPVVPCDRDTIDV
ncbi:MAG: GTP-binding protein, partial [Planctomycetes bacterium]|nr:GTP-binding protein [Planctomycetota bacterium]